MTVKVNKKKKNTKRKKKRNSHRKTKKQGFWQKLWNFLLTYKVNLLGLLFLIVSLLGIFNLGLVGTFFANIFRMVVGNSYQILLILLGLWGVLLLGNQKLPKIKDHFIIGFVIAYLGYLLFSSIRMFALLDQNVLFLNTTWETLANDFATNVVKANVGGGLLGSGLLSVFNKLISLIGTEIFAGILIATGIIVFFKIPVIKYTKVFVTYCCNLISAQIAKSKRRKLAKQNDASVIQRHTDTSTFEDEQVASNDHNNDDDKVVDSPSYDEQPSENTITEKPKIRMASDNQPKTKLAMDPKPLKKVDGDYQLPPLSLLTKVPAQNQKAEYNAIDKNTSVLQKTLKSFGVDAEVKNVNLGPSVTEYELRPAIGVKVSKIVNLSDDLALALAANDIRIEAPIPGKSLIGIEVPNKDVSTVSFKDVFESQGKKAMENILSVPLGKDVSGNVVSCDITKMPHLLIAGATGSGKSVAINDILTSILLKADPDQVKLMLIDPKKVELGVYNDIPHLLSPVVSDPKKAARALGKVVAEMENRYELFAKSGQRKISTYNKFVKEQNKKDGTDIPTLPYIVVVVDELADLMMTVSNEVESAIIRLAQMGRAAGVHMILATQRPSVDVITGLIKANVPSRIAFAVSSGTDSRTILDSNGAEKLLGRGDMLYQPIGRNKPVRVQGSFISDHDVESVVDFVKKEGKPEYDDQMVVTDDEIKQEEDDEEKDDLFDEALAFVVHEHKASTSMLQRRFRIGYNRAARIIDDMEQRGYVGPQRGSVPRTVYKQEDEDK